MVTLDSTKRTCRKRLRVNPSASSSLSVWNGVVTFSLATLLTNLLAVPVSVITPLVLISTLQSQPVSAFISNLQQTQPHRQRITKNLLELNHFHSHISKSNRQTTLIHNSLDSKNNDSDDSESDPSVSSSSLRTSTNTRLSHEEQLELLRLAVELRRLKRLESELALQSPNLRPTKAQLAKEAGYGNDLDSLETAMDMGYKAREKLVTSNMGLVHHCVNEILYKKSHQGLIGKSQQSSSSSAATSTLSKDDLVQEGAWGLARAVDRWNPAVGGKFSTYAYYWIRAAILRAIAANQDVDMRVPEHVSAAVRQLTKAIGLANFDGDALLNALYNKDDDAHYWKEAQAAKALAERAGLTERQMAEAIKVKQRRSKGTLSLETWINDYGEKAPVGYSSTETEIDNNNGPMPEEQSSQHEHIKSTLARYLRPREMEALSWRYGLNVDNKRKSRNYVAEAEKHLFGETDLAENNNNNNNNNRTVQPISSSTSHKIGGRWGEAMSFVEVGKQMKCSAEYGRRLCQAALTKLRQAAEDGRLEPAFLY